MSTTSTTSITLDPAIRERLQRLADAQQRPAQLVMQEAIAEYVERQEKQELFAQDAQLALDDYQATGLHLTASEVDAWLAKLEDGENAKMPAWHE